MRWTWIGLLACACGGGAVEGTLDGSWSGVCLGQMGTIDEGRDVNVAIASLRRTTRVLDDSVGVTGELLGYVSDGTVDDTLMADVNVYHCVGERCTIGDDTYDRGEILVQFEQQEGRTAPGSGFLYLGPTDDPDTLRGECIVVPAGGAGDVLGGTIDLTRP